jgi:AraC-like DNA-binding protein
MQTIDFTELIDPAVLQTVVPKDASLVEGLYESGEGAQFKSHHQARRISQEVVRLAEGALLMASESESEKTTTCQQVVTGSDWVHIQFRLTGGGQETFPLSEVIQTPNRSCIVARYPKDSVLERSMDYSGGWKVACLFINPRALASFLELPIGYFPESLRWLAEEASLDLRATVLPLQARMALAVNDILNCGFRGFTRRAFMRAKALELLSSVLDTMNDSRPEWNIKLSSADVRKIWRARQIMTNELEATMTLAELAHNVGLNRTKLALGFKGVYGISVQAYWRDSKLDRARELLRSVDMPVTEVALRLGYSELSSFTRAFTRRFGVSPRECRLRTKLLVTRD